MLHEETERIDNSTRIAICQAVGLKRQLEFYDFWIHRYPATEGYAVEWYHKKTKGSKPDVIIYKDRDPYMVVEVKNYKLDGYMIAPTLARAIERLTQYNCYRLLIISTEENLRIRKLIPKPNRHYVYRDSSHTKKLLEKNGISIMVMGRQNKLTDAELNYIIEDQRKKRLMRNKPVQGWIE